MNDFLATLDYIYYGDIPDGKTPNHPSQTKYLHIKIGDFQDAMFLTDDDSLIFRLSEQEKKYNYYTRRYNERTDT